MSPLEGLIVASTFNKVEQINFYERSLYAFENKKFTLEGVKFNDLFLNFIKSQKNIEKTLIILESIIRSPSSRQERLAHYKNEVIIYLSNIFIQILCNY